MIQRVIDRVAFWWPRCAACCHRKPEFVDALCFGCAVDRLEKRAWDNLERAIERLYGVVR